MGMLKAQENTATSESLRAIVSDAAVLWLRGWRKRCLGSQSPALTQSRGRQRCSAGQTGYKDDRRIMRLSLTQIGFRVVGPGISADYKRRVQETIAFVELRRGAKFVRISNGAVW
jgi:hypothetical protein